MLPAQTGSRLRGLGRFARTLATGLLQARGDAVSLGASLHAEQSPQALADSFAPLAPRVLAYGDAPRERYWTRAGWERAVLRERGAFIAASGADVVVTPAWFEGWGEHCEPLQPARFANAASRPLQVAAVHDFIPLQQPAVCLDPYPGMRRWYERRLAAYGQADLLIALSQHVRRETIETLAVPPSRVVVVPAAVASVFFEAPPQPHAVQALHARLGLSRPFVMGIGPDDVRKNLGGLLQAWSRLPGATRQSHQLAIAGVQRGEPLLKRARGLGLAEDQLVLLPHVPDTELAALYASCRLFVFSSLAEGFGLPVVEAMACGAPVLAGNNTSLPEVVGRADALFDAGSADAIAQAMVRGLQDADWRAALARHGREHAAGYTQGALADAVWTACEQALAQRMPAAY